MVENTTPLTKQEFIALEISKIVVGTGDKKVSYVDYYGANAPLFAKMMALSVRLKLAPLSERRVLQSSLDNLAREGFKVGFPKSIYGNVSARAERIKNLVLLTFPQP